MVLGALKKQFTLYNTLRQYRARAVEMGRKVNSFIFL
jgi:hypothetical protein